MNRLIKAISVSLGALVFSACTDHVADFDDLNRDLTVKIKNGYFTDPRDKNTYKVVQLDDNIWMAENLRYTDSSETKNLKSHVWCPDNKKENCEKFGPLYSWTAAMNIDKEFSTKAIGGGFGNVRGICPSGWYLPSKQEWIELEKYIDLINRSEGVATSLKDAESWNAHDSIEASINRFGFAAMAAGRRNSDNEEFQPTGKFAYFWSSTEVDEGTAGGAAFLHNDDKLSPSGFYYKDHGMSVRCVLSTYSTNVKFDTTDDYKPWEPSFKYGSLEIEGVKHKTIKIDSQVWMAENVNVDKGDNHCFNDSKEYCEKYGRLYDWKTASEICPDGWHLPTVEDFEILTKNTPGIDLLSIDGWTKNNGTNRWGFNALPAGAYESSFFDSKYTAYFWTADKSSENTAEHIILRYYSTEAEFAPQATNTFESVRCVKD